MSETIADIVREMRIFRCRNLESGELELCTSTARYFADRIEVAYKREIDTITAEREEWRKQALEVAARVNEATAEKSSAVGNAAKMREALKELRDIVHDAFWSKDGVVKGDVLNALRRANVALAAPPRNCDKFQSLGIISMADSPIDATLIYASREKLLKFIRWLFAPAKEGDNDADK